MAHNSLSMYLYFTIHYIAILQFPFHVFIVYCPLHCHTAIVLTYTQLCVNNTVSTCTRTDAFMVITTKDQSGGMYNSYSTSGQGFMAVVNKPHPPGTPSDSVCLLP